MPTYELALLLRNMPKHETKTTLKRISQSIFNRNGFIRTIENLGLQPTPFKINAHGINYREASYFLIKFDFDRNKVNDIREEYDRDVDIIRKSIYCQIPPENKPCQLDAEMQIPAYRKDVQKLMKVTKGLVNPFKKAFKPNSLIDYHPFQK